MKFTLKEIDGKQYTYVNHFNGLYLLKEPDKKNYIILHPDGSAEKVKSKKREWLQKIKESKQ